MYVCVFARPLVVGRILYNTTLKILSRDASCDDRYGGVSQPSLSEGHCAHPVWWRQARKLERERDNASRETQVRGQ